MNTLAAYLFVGVGGALGAMARYALNVAFQRDWFFPWGTLSANLLGCLAMGAIAWLVAHSAWFNSAGLIPDQYRLLFAVGFCGSFTTLSALVLEVDSLWQRDDLLGAFVYLTASVAGGFACFYVGYRVMRLLARSAA